MTTLWISNFAWYCIFPWPLVRLYIKIWRKKQILKILCKIWTAKHFCHPMWDWVGMSVALNAPYTGCTESNYQERSPGTIIQALNLLSSFFMCNLHLPLLLHCQATAVNTFFFYFLKIVLLKLVILTLTIGLHHWYN